VAGCITRKARVNISRKTREVNVVDIQPAHDRPLSQPQVTRVPNNPYGVTRMLNVDRDDTRVNYRRKKLEQLSVQQSVQQIQNARLKLASLLNYVRRAKSAFGDLNVKPTRLAFLKLLFPSATFSIARSVPLLRDRRPVSLQPNT